MNIPSYVRTLYIPFSVNCRFSFRLLLFFFSISRGFLRIRESIQEPLKYCFCCAFQMLDLYVSFDFRFAPGVFCLVQLSLFYVVCFSNLFLILGFCLLRLGLERLFFLPRVVKEHNEIFFLYLYLLISWFTFNHWHICRVPLCLV